MAFNSITLIFSIIIILIIVISSFIGMSYYITSYNEKELLFHINGFYTADPIFCEQAGLSLIILYFKDKDGYILIKDQSENILLNSSFTYILNPISKLNKLHGECKYTIEFLDLPEQDFFPKKQQFEFIPETHRIKLFDAESKTIYAVLYKNNAASDLDTEEIAPTESEE